MAAPIRTLFLLYLLLWTKHPPYTTASSGRFCPTRVLPLIILRPASRPSYGRGWISPPWSNCRTATCPANCARRFRISSILANGKTLPIQVRQEGGKGGVKVSLLVEHKSFMDRHAPLQIGSYIFSGLLKQVRNGEKPSLIIPVLLYHGRDKWEYRTLKDLFGDIEPEWGKYIPDFDYIYHNLSEVPDEQLEVLNNNFLKASLLALKHSFERGWLEANAVKLLVWSGDAAENLHKGFFVYLVEQGQIESKKILKIMEALPSSVKKKAKNALDYFREEGLREGLQKGRQEGRREGRQEGLQEQTKKVVRNLVRASGLADEQIAEMTEVSVDYVVRIRKEMESGDGGQRLMVNC